MLDINTSSRKGADCLKVNKNKNQWLEWGKALLIALLIAFFLKSFVFSTSIIEGESMSPTIKNGNKIVYNKIVYLIGKPKRGDIVIIQKTVKNYVKRVIALPGEEIQMKDHVLYINGEASDQDFVSKENKMRTGNFGPISIPKKSYFVMGDNRAISNDSRNKFGLGLIEEKNIIGRSEIIIHPLDDWSKTE